MGANRKKVVVGKNSQIKPNPTIPKEKVAAPPAAKAKPVNIDIGWLQDYAMDIPTRYGAPILNWIQSFMPLAKELAESKQKSKE